MEVLQRFVSLFASLIIIMDPLGNLPLMLLFTAQHSPREQREIAATAVAAACAILLLFALAGDAILRLFGVELAAFQLAGGFIFFVYALQMLRLTPSGIKTSPQEEAEGATKAHVALVPLATPLLAGPGAITAVLVHQQDLASRASLPLYLLTIVAACAVVLVVLLFARPLQRLLGVGGIRVLERLMGLLLAVLAMQFVVSGLRQILG